MNADRGPSRGRLRRSLLVALCLVVLVGGALAVVLQRRRPRGPALVNRPTRAREARPFTTRPDPRFDPLPLERERHAR